jgi:PAS domain S-box-containing protein
MAWLAEVLDMEIGSSGKAFDLFHLLNAVPVGVLILDRERRVVFCNRAVEAMTGLPAPSAVGLACHNVMRHRVCLVDCPALGIEQGDKSVCIESDLINRDRKRVPARLTLSALKDDEGGFAGYVETVEDLSLLKAYDQKTSRAYSFGNIIGQSSEMEKLFAILPVIAHSDSSVLITGETGTGKDMLAEAIHQASDRAKGPFIKINCGALPETLLESELFGHTKGAFTGAVENKQGRFHLAHNGTLYLTEIGDLPLQLQVKLLTFLDDKVVYPLGGTKGFQANVRIIAATHRNLEQMVKEGRFRQDLFFRLNVLNLRIPALRQRQGDARILLDHFLTVFTRKLGRAINGYAPKTLKILLGYTYPGNVRELRNIVEYAVNICQEDKITPRHLPSYLTTVTALEAAAPSEVIQPQIAAKIDQNGSDDTWPALEKRMISDALVMARGNRSRTAAALGWSRSTLWRKIKQHHLEET